MAKTAAAKSANAKLKAIDLPWNPWDFVAAASDSQYETRDLLQQLLSRFYTSVLRHQLFHYKKLHKPSTGLELHLSGENLNGENLNSIKSLEAPESDGTNFNISNHRLITMLYSWLIGWGRENCCTSQARYSLLGRWQVHLHARVPGEMQLQPAQPFRKNTSE